LTSTARPKACIDHVPVPLAAGAWRRDRPWRQSNEPLTSPSRVRPGSARTCRRAAGDESESAARRACGHARERTGPAPGVDHELPSLRPPVEAQLRDREQPQPRHPHRTAGAPEALGLQLVSDGLGQRFAGGVQTGEREAAPPGIARTSEHDPPALYPPGGSRRADCKPRRADHRLRTDERHIPRPDRQRHDASREVRRVLSPTPRRPKRPGQSETAAFHPRLGQPTGARSLIAGHRARAHGPAPAHAAADGGVLIRFTDQAPGGPIPPASRTPRRVDIGVVARGLDLAPARRRSETRSVPGLLAVSHLSTNHSMGEPVGSARADGCSALTTHRLHPRSPTKLLCDCRGILC